MHPNHIRGPLDAPMRTQLPWFTAGNVTASAAITGASCCNTPAPCPTAATTAPSAQTPLSKSGAGSVSGPAHRRRGYFNPNYAVLALLVETVSAPSPATAGIAQSNPTPVLPLPATRTASPSPCDHLPVRRVRFLVRHDHAPDILKTRLVLSCSRLPRLLTSTDSGFVGGPFGRKSTARKGRPSRQGPFSVARSGVAVGTRCIDARRRSRPRRPP